MRTGESGKNQIKKRSREFCVGSSSTTPYGFCCVYLFSVVASLLGYLLRYVKKSGIVTPVMPQSNTHTGVDNRLEFSGQ